MGRAAARPRNAVNGGRRTRGISAARKAGLITGTANEPTARGAGYGDTENTDTDAIAAAADWRHPEWIADGGD